MFTVDLILAETINKTVEAILVEELAHQSIERQVISFVVCVADDWSLAKRVIDEAEAYIMRRQLNEFRKASIDLSDRDDSIRKQKNVKWTKKCHTRMCDLGI